MRKLLVRGKGAAQHGIHYITVSDVDYPTLKRHHIYWRYHPKTGGFAVTYGLPGAIKTYGGRMVAVHRLIRRGVDPETKKLRPNPEGRVLLFKNEDRTDCTRGNVVWRAKQRQHNGATKARSR